MRKLETQHRPVLRRRVPNNSRQTESIHKQHLARPCPSHDHSISNLDARIDSTRSPQRTPRLQPDRILSYRILSYRMA